ncbi:MAG: CBS domain-containing protein [Bacilli bacterium]|nr:CBS domain-containing protein [Bacilli bacterium]
MANYNNATTEEFLNLYRQLEGIRAESGNDLSYYESKYHAKLEDFRRLRNYLSHEEFGGDFPVAVSSKVNEDFKAILLKMQARIYEHAHRPQYITKQDKVLHAINKLNENRYTYLPVLENGILIGVATSGSLLHLLAKHEQGEELIEEDATIGDYMPYFSLDNQKTRFLIAGRNMLLSSAEQAFSSIENGKRLGAIFVTEKGNPNEKVLGILTIYDVLGYSKE